MFVNIRTRTEIVRLVRAGITTDAEPMVIGVDKLQPIYIVASYRFDSFTLAENHDVTVTMRVIRRNGTVGDREVYSTWAENHPEMPQWAVDFLREHKPDPSELS